MAALGHTSTPFCFVVRQFLGFFQGQVRLSEVSFDDIYPVINNEINSKLRCRFSFAQENVGHLPSCALL